MRLLLLAAITLVLGCTAPAFSQTTSPTVALSPEIESRPGGTTTDGLHLSPRRSTRVRTEGFEWLADVTAADDFMEDADAEATFTLPYSRAAEGVTKLPAAAYTFQPAGALSGKIVYLMAGHGWTYNDQTQTWYTQRPPTHGMIEDLGNLDQMHIFARMVWNLGGTVVPLRPVDHQPEERVIDNSMPQATFYGPWAASTSKIYYGSPRDRVPYQFARAELEESAVARFRPYLPVEGEYPVYVWSRDGNDRVSQLYRVVHAGGTHEVRVNHRLVGKGWVWLGTYRFEKGDKGYVEVSNKIVDPYYADGRHVVVADAVRFGNGRGDVAREGGISSYLREDEGDAYWIARSLGHTAPYQLYTVGRVDGSATVSAPPKTVAYMNRETEGRYTDRVLISFHSNAANARQRGAVSLFNRSPDQRPAYQELLAELTGRQINEDMVKAPSLPDLPWSERTRHTYNGINFGELRKDYLQGEVCATIVEVAFHDESQDARYLVSPKGRLDLARSTMRGLIKWFDAVEMPRHATAMPPAMPTAPRALPGEEPGTVRFDWQAPASNGVVGNPAVDYRVFVSYNGRAFDGGVVSDGATSLSLKVASTTAPVFARVAGVNASGESLAARVVAVLPEAPVQQTEEFGESTTAPANILIVDGMSTLDSRLNQLYRQHVVDPNAGPGWTVQRVRPLPLLEGEAVVRAAEALTSAGVTFSTVQAATVGADDFNLSGYDAIVWLAGRQSPTEEILSPAVRDRLTAYLKGGGKLFLSGSHVAESLTAPGAKDGSESGRNFAGRVLGVTSATLNSGSRSLMPASDIAALPESLQLEPEATTLSLPDALPSDVLTKASGSNVRELLTYRWPATGAAAVATDNVVYFAFPFESISGAENRIQVMRAILELLGVR